ncbi:MAG: helix-turn-helix domain-containing protein, partial [Gammaproteobacteria bacterium]
PRHLREGLGRTRNGSVEGLEEGAVDAEAEPLIPLAEVEARYLKRALSVHEGDRKSLAAALGISERALYRKLAKLNG